MTGPRKILVQLGKAARHPSTALSVLFALARGRWYSIVVPATGRRFRTGRNFRVFGKLVIHGPGSVVFGDDVTIGMTVTPFTHDKNAEIHVGSRVFLNGTRFGCSMRIDIGDDCILAECRVTDSNFHSVYRERHLPSAPVVQKPVSIHRNVWVCPDVAILPGTSIGENSVISIGSVCRGNLESDSIFAGNPALRVGAVPSLATPLTEG